MISSAPCFYCQERYDFTDEHVIPACIGGDDSQWLLRGCICSVCNNEFSILEAAFARSSPVALARVMFQKTGRDRGKDTKAISFRAKKILATDDEGITSVAQIRAGFKTTLAAQVHQIGDNELQVRGSDCSEIDALLDRLRSLPANFELIDKKHSRLYICTQIIEGLEGYIVAGAVTDKRRPPRDGVWFAPMPHQSSLTRPFVVLGDGGQLNCHASSLTEALKLLFKARSIKPEITSQLGDARFIDKPSVMMEMSIDINAYYRIIAKIGLNIFAFIEGPQAISVACFERARRYVRYGEQSLGLLPMPDKELPAGIKAWLQSRHYLTIRSVEREGEHYLCFIPYIYGIGIGAVILSQSRTSILQRPITLLVDYIANRIIRM